MILHWPTVGFNPGNGRQRVVYRLISLWWYIGYKGKVSPVRNRHETKSHKRRGSKSQRIPTSATNCCLAAEPKFAAYTPIRHDLQSLPSTIVVTTYFPTIHFLSSNWLYSEMCPNPLKFCMHLIPPHVQPFSLHRH
jgi:hypothetical protein